MHKKFFLFIIQDFYSCGSLFYYHFAAEWLSFILVYIHKCLKWEDYELTRHELEEADRLCHGNWIEIQRLYAYIDELRSILEENNIDYPEI